MTIDETELARLEALAQAATPGPWAPTAVCDDDDHWYACSPEHAFAEDDPACDSGKRHPGALADAAFIAAARDAVPALVAEVRRLREQLQEERDILKDFQSGRIVNCPQHGIAIQMAPDPVEAERDALRNQLAEFHSLLDWSLGAIQAAIDECHDDVEDTVDGCEMLIKIKEAIGAEVTDQDRAQLAAAQKASDEW